MIAEQICLTTYRFRLILPYLQPLPGMVGPGSVFPKVELSSRTGEYIADTRIRLRYVVLTTQTTILGYLSYKIDLSLQSSV